MSGSVRVCEAVLVRLGGMLRDAEFTISRISTVRLKYAIKGYFVFFNSSVEKVFLLLHVSVGNEVNNLPSGG